MTPTIRRLKGLYDRQDYGAGDRQVDEILELYPKTDFAASALYLRSLFLRTRDDQEAAFVSVLDDPS